MRTTFFTRRSPSTRGFTLIELLVVMAIIGLLASVVLGSLRFAQSKARDSQRLSDIHQVQTAIELYRNDNGSFPSTSGSWWGTCSGFGTHAVSGASGWVPDLAPTYIRALPIDPKPINPNNCYLYNSDGADYMIVAYGTVETILPANNHLLRPSQPTEADFALYTPGAADW